MRRGGVRGGEEGVRVRKKNSLINHGQCSADKYSYNTVDTWLRNMSESLK